MNRLVWPRTSLCAAVSLLMTLGAGAAQAAGDDNSLSLKIASALKSDRVFVRAGVIYVKIKTKAGDTQDVTGPVVTYDELANVGLKDASNYSNLDLTFPGAPLGDADLAAFTREQVRDAAFNPEGGILQDPTAGIPAVLKYMRDNGLTGIGTPPGIKGVASDETGTAGISLGYYLDEEYKWAVEAYILAKPPSTSVRVQGTTKPFGEPERPILINGAKIITSKLLPPLVMLGRYWGDKDSTFRAFTGAMGMYAMFYDTKATETLNTYVGGSNPGDTTVSIKNTFGMGPVLGFKYQFADAWHASLNVGHVKLRTTAKLVTRNTSITSQSQIIQDLGGISEPINAGESIYRPNTPGCLDPLFCDFVARNGGLTTILMKAIAGDRGQSNLGTYVRETKTELTNTIFMLSVGRTF